MKQYIAISILILFGISSIVFSEFTGFSTRETKQTISNQEKIFTEPLVLKGNQVLEIKQSNITFKNNIILEDHAQLIIEDSHIKHEKDHIFQYSLEARDQSKVIVKNTQIANQCTGSLNWNFLENASFNADHIAQKDCNIYVYATDSSQVNINAWDWFSMTLCQQSNVAIANSKNLELELCFPRGASVNTSLPKEIKSYFMNGKNTFNLNIENSTVDQWGISLVPETNIVIRDTHEASLSVVVGLPMKKKIVVLDGLRDGYYAYKKWSYEQTNFEIFNTTIKGWEPNVFASENILIIKNSNITGSTMNSEKSIYLIINTSAEVVRTQERVQMYLINSIINTDAIATENSKIILIDSEVKGNMVMEDNGLIVQQEELPKAVYEKVKSFL